MATEGAFRDLRVEGSLPVDLDGAFLRVGPNPKFPPLGGYHWFDGDGMLHAVTLSQGRASYANHLVRTERLAYESEQGAARFLKIGDMRYATGLVLILLFRLRQLLGLAPEDVSAANTALLFHGGALLALHEYGVPYAMAVHSDGRLETLGAYLFGGRLPRTQHFTAHPKVDPVTGELFFFGYDLERAPHFTLGFASPRGALERLVPVPLPDPVMAHDFAITEHFVIVPDLPYCFRPQSVLSGGFGLQFERHRRARFGIGPRAMREASELRWFEAPACFFFHVVNAWEEREGQEVVLVACCDDSVDLGAGLTNFKPQLREFHFDLRSGMTRMAPLGVDLACDFPRINESLLGRRARFAYCSTMVGARFDGVIKVDLLARAVRGSIKYREGTFAGECVFVPRRNAADEDDGYLLTLAHDELMNESALLVFDAATMSARPLARVLLPRRVPYGFHGLFLSREQLAAQTAL